MAPSGQASAVSGSSTIIYVDDGGDYVTVQLYQSSGASLNAISDNDDSTFITIARLDMATQGSGTASGTSGHIQISDGAGGFTHDANAIFWDAANNRLGVNTATPAYTIDTTASGTVRAATFTGSLTGTADVATTVTLNGSGNVTYYPTFVDATSGNENIRVDSDWTYNASTNKMTVGNIAVSTTIGHTSDTDLLTLASGALTVAGTVTSSGQIKVSGTTGSGVWIDRTDSANSYLRLSNTTDSNGYLGYEGTNMVFNTANSTRMTLSDTGLGIGVGSMNSVLHVQKDASTTWNTSGYSNPYNYQPHPHELAIINTQDNTTNSFAGIYFGAGETSSGSQINSARIAAIRTAAFTTDLAFASRGAAGAFAEKMRIQSDGSVGIGTASPNALLHVEGGSDPTIFIRQTNANDANSGKLAFGEADNNEQAWIKYEGSANVLKIETIETANALVMQRTTGNVGIGNADPDGFHDNYDNLVVGTGSGHNGITVYSGNDSQGGLIFHDAINTSLSGFVTYDHNVDYMYFGTGGLGRISIFGGISPTLRLGIGQEYDTKVLFDGNQVDYHIGLRDGQGSATNPDTLMIGTGTTLGSNTAIMVDTNRKVTVSGALTLAGAGTPGADKVLTSNAEGDATWEEASAGGSSATMTVKSAVTVTQGQGVAVNSDGEAVPFSYGTDVSLFHINEELGPFIQGVDAADTAQGWVSNSFINYRIMFYDYNNNKYICFFQFKSGRASIAADPVAGGDHYIDSGTYPTDANGEKPMNDLLGSGNEIDQQYTWITCVGTLNSSTGVITWSGHQKVPLAVQPTDANQAWVRATGQYISMGEGITYDAEYQGGGNYSAGRIVMVYDTYDTTSYMSRYNKHIMQAAYNTSTGKLDFSTDYVYATHDYLDSPGHAGFLGYDNSKQRIMLTKRPTASGNNSTGNLQFYVQYLAEFSAGNSPVSGTGGSAVTPSFYWQGNGIAVRNPSSNRVALWGYINPWGLHYHRPYDLSGTTLSSTNDTTHTSNSYGQSYLVIRGFQVLKHDNGTGDESGMLSLIHI